MTYSILHFAFPILISSFPIHQFSFSIIQSSFPVLDFSSPSTIPQRPIPYTRFHILSTSSTIRPPTIHILGYFLFVYNAPLVCAILGVGNMCGTEAENWHDYAFKCSTSRRTKPHEKPSIWSPRGS